MTIPRIVWLWIVASTPIAVLHADTVFLDNSDRLSGEIQKLEGKHLYLKTSYAGTLEIDWTMVQGISSDRALQFSMRNGSILTGTVRSAPEGMQVSSVNSETSILPYEVKAISKRMEEQTLVNRLDGSIELGYSLTRGNSPLSQSSVAANADYHSAHLRVQTDVSSLFSKQAPAQSASTHSAFTRLDFYLTPGAFAFLLGSLERDDRELLNLRSTAGGGMGWQIAHSPVVAASLIGGLTFVSEDYRGGQDDPGRGRSGEALASLSLDRFQLGRLRFTGKTSVFPSLLDGGRFRVVMNAGVRMPVVKHLIWSVRLFERFDSRPVLAVKRHDYGLISSFGFAF